MILNGFNVAASLIRKGEDPVVNRADFASMYNITKRDLTAARERSGCYSLTRYHLNQAAALLGIKETDFKYRVTPAMLKTDGAGRVEVSGADAQSQGATGQLDPSAVYTANVTTTTDTDDLLLDLAGAAMGGDYAPQEAQSRLSLLMDAAAQNGDSLVGAMIGAMENCKFVRYNAGSIEELAGSLSAPEKVRTQAAALTHLALAIFGAASTGAALGMLRMFIATGALYNYDETWELRKWLRSSSQELVGVTAAMSGNEVKPNAKFDRIADTALKCRQQLLNSPYAKPKLLDLQDAAVYTQETMTKSLAGFVEAMGKGINQRNAEGDQLDIEQLVSKTNKLLAMTPQLIRKQV